MTENEQSRLDRLEAENEQLKQRIEQLEQQTTGQSEWINRREIMGALVATIGIPALVGSASASDTEPANFDCVWTGDQNAADYELWNLAGLDVNKLLSTLDVSGHDIEDSGSTIYDQSAGEVPNAIVAALSNFGVNEAFTAYPISLGNDTDTDLDTTDLSDGNETVYDSSANELASDVNNQLVTTDEANITGETVVEADRQSSTGTISSGTDTNIVDTEQTDNRNELDSNLQFSPDKSGEYHFYGVVGIDPGAAGDELRCKIENVTDGSRLNPFLFIWDINSSSQHVIPYSARVTLDPSKKYRVVVNDQNNSYSLFGGGANKSVLNIDRQVVHD